MSSIKQAANTVVGRNVGQVGYGLLGLSIPQAPLDYDVAAPVIKKALESGWDFWNGGIHYGTPEKNSLHLLEHYFGMYPEDVDKVVLSIKGVYDPMKGPQGSREGIRASVETAVAVLDGVKTIDVFEMARVDPKTPIEESVMALAELVKEGKIRGIGMSKVSAETIRKADEVHQIAAVSRETQEDISSCNVGLLHATLRTTPTHRGRRGCP